MSSLFRDWVTADSFGYSHSKGHPESGEPFTSVRQLLQLLFGSPVGTHEGFSLPQVHDLNIPLNAVLKMTVHSASDAPKPVEYYVYSGICFANMPALLYEVSCHSPSDNGAAEFNAMLGASPFKTWRELSTAILHGPVTATISHSLLNIFREMNGTRTALSFFMTQAMENGYQSWGSNASALWTGKLLKQHDVQVADGLVEIKVSSYVDSIDGDSVCAYEWNAELRKTAGSTDPDAIAYGMVYKFRRANGWPLGSLTDLAWAADAIADADVSQVAAFIDQHPDAAAAVEEGDICFVWLWERKNGSQKGIGAQCMLAAIKDMKKRFPAIKTIVISVNPSQFVRWNEPCDPPQVQLEKHEAIDKVACAIESLSLDKIIHGEVHLIIEKPMSEREVLAYLGGKTFF